MGVVSYKYGMLSSEQVKEYKDKMRKSIFFLLLCVDNKTKDSYSGIDVDASFENIMNRLNGFNRLLYYPTEIVTVMSLLESAREEYSNADFDFHKYRKLILDAGSEVLKIKERDSVAEY